MPMTLAHLAVAANELRAFLAYDSLPEVVDDFVDLVGRLPTTSKAQASNTPLA